MPVPSDAEIMDLWTRAYSHLKVEVVRRRREFWGPIPQRIFAALDSDVETRFRDAAAKVTWDQLRRVLEGDAWSTDDAARRFSLLRATAEAVDNPTYGADDFRQLAGLHYTSPAFEALGMKI